MTQTHYPHSLIPGFFGSGHTCIMLIFDKISILLGYSKWQETVECSMGNGLEKTPLSAMCTTRIEHEERKRCGRSVWERSSVGTFSHQSILASPVSPSLKSGPL